MGLMLIYVPRVGARCRGATGAAPRVRGLRGYGGSAGPRAAAAAGALVGVPALPEGDTAALRGDGHASPLAEIARRPRGENKFSNGRAAGGLAAGRAGQKAEIWDGFPRASSWLQSPQNFERGFFPLLHFTPLPALPLRASPSQKPALVFTSSGLGLEFGPWCGGNDQPFVSLAKAESKSKATN